MKWYIIKNAMYEGYETLGPFKTKKQAMYHCGYDCSQSHKVNAGLYTKGKDYIGTKEELLSSGFNWAFEGE